MSHNVATSFHHNALSKSSVGHESGTIVESNLSGESRTLGIATTPEMFAILSKRMYSYQIRAIIRETCCNARDSHIDYGCLNLPIEVKLPTKLDPTFYVQDFGIGINDHDMLAIYMVYGESTKRSDMRTTGGFGLGCKSPYAYLMEHRDQNSGFTVTSTKDGRRVIYYFHLSAQGLPSHVQVADLERPAEGWDDGVDHGVRVSMSVRIEDIPKFIEEAKYVFKHFDVKPNIVGASVELTNEKYLLEGETFGIRGNTPAVVTGCVEYPITSQYVPKNDVETAFIQAGIVLKLPVGAVMMTPSREQLEYVTHTAEGLRVGFKHATDEFTKRMREVILADYDTASPWDWRGRIRSLYLTFPESIRRLLVTMPILTAICENTKLDPKSLSHTLSEGHVELTASIGAGKIARQHTVYARDEQGSIMRDDEGMMIVESSSTDFRAHVARFAERRYGRGSSVQKQEVIDGKLMVRDKVEKIYLTLTSEVGVFVADTSYSDQRVREWVDAESGRVAFLFSPQKGGTVAHAEAHAQLMLNQDDLIGLPLRRTSDIPFTPVQRAKAVRVTQGQSWADQVSDVELPQLTPGAASLDDLYSQTPLSDVEEDGQFYLVCDHSILHDRHSNRRRFWCVDPQDEAIIAGNSNLSYMVETMKLLAMVKAPVSGIVVVDSIPQLRRLKLAENGFQPFWPWFIKWFKDNVLDTLTTSARELTTFENVTPNHLNHNKDELVWAGVFDVKFRNALIAGLGPGHIMVKDILDVKARISKKYDQATTDPDQLLRELAGDVFRHGLRVSSSKIDIPYQVRHHKHSYQIRSLFDNHWHELYKFVNSRITLDILDEADPVIYQQRVDILVSAIKLAASLGGIKNTTFEYLD